MATLKTQYKFIVVCPTYNAKGYADEFISAIASQSRKPDCILIIDSGSKDSSVKDFEAAGFNLHCIPNDEFNHGATRNLAFDKFGDYYDFYVLLTQDAILADKDAIKNILLPFEDEEVGAVCGRQIPRLGAKPIEAHARLFNYPAKSQIKDKNDINRLGIKTAFMSNSFAAYRYKSFMDVGGFPKDTIFAEDMCTAARMILKGHKIAYAAEAKVFHSHTYTILEEFKRYFDVGVFYNREKWIKKNFGSAGSEGLRFVKSELMYLIKNKEFVLILNSGINTFSKFAAFKIGGLEKFLPNKLKVKLSMNRKYWK